MRILAGLTMAVACLFPRLAWAQPSSGNLLETPSHRALDTRLGSERTIRLPKSLPGSVLSLEAARNLLRSLSTRGNTSGAGPREDQSPTQDRTPNTLTYEDASQGFRRWMQRQGIWPADVDETLPRVDPFNPDSGRSSRDAPLEANSAGASPPRAAGMPRGDSFRGMKDMRDSDLDRAVRRQWSRWLNERNDPAERMLPTAELLEQLGSLYDNETAQRFLRNLANGQSISTQRNTAERNTERAETSRANSGRQPPATASPPRTGPRPREGDRQGVASRSPRTAPRVPSRQVPSSDMASPSAGVSRRLLESLIEVIDSTGTELVKAARDPKRRQSWAWMSQRQKQVSQWIKKHRRQSAKWQSSAIIPQRPPRPPTPPRMPSLPEMSSTTARTTLVLVLLAIGSVVAFLYWRRPTIPTGQIDQSSLPAAVPPAAVNDRNTLIEACHGLAVRQLGWQTQFWNHLRLFEGLTGTLPEHQGELVQLSRIYERARYASGEFDLTSEQLQQARGILASLEG